MSSTMVVDPTIAVEPTFTHSPPTPATDVAIQVRGVGKMYRIYDRPQDRLKQMLWRGRRMYGHEFWALRDISFDVHKGDTVGIIGRNGSGKSTLLQIIAGTLAPTEGEIAVHGRVAALLELGSGFNPEFTGRENVFLNGAILGFSREEMALYFDDIVAFADIGEFIDQPVKLYSSGMVVRLAFAVQAFVPKEVLIVDEALAVGDIFFQAKCMAQMRRLLDNGVTVLFVNHETGAVKSLCRRALLLDHGRMIENSTADIVAEKYYSLKVRSEQALLRKPYEGDSLDRYGDRENPDNAFTPSADFLKRAAFQRLQNGKAYFLNVQLLDHYGKEIAQVEYDQEVTLRMAIQVTADIPDMLEFGYHIRDANGVDLVYSDSIIEQTGIAAPQQGNRYLADWTFKAALQAGNYTIAVGMSIPINLHSSLVDSCDFIPLAVQFNIEPRRESYLYGAVHWDNLVRVQQHGKAADV
jgi:lipopolysaccharide transport system ATP-binding protein